MGATEEGNLSFKMGLSPLKVDIFCLCFQIENWETEYQLIYDKAASLEKELQAKTVNQVELNEESIKSAAVQQELEEAWVCLREIIYHNPPQD